MDDQVAQPTILVKKSDGTTERITLAELKARQAGAQTVPVVPVIAPVIPSRAEESLGIASSPTVSQAPRNDIEKPHGLVVGPHEKKIIMPTLVMPKPLEIVIPSKVEESLDKLRDSSTTLRSGRNDSEKPLLHEEVPESPHAQTTTVPTRLDQADKIIFGLSFKVPAQFSNRLRSAIQLRLKDIRSEADTKDLCLRSIKDGGLGLTETQAQEVVIKAKPMAMEIKIKDKDQFDLPAKIELSPAPVVPMQKISQEVSNKEAVVDKIIGQGSSMSAPTIADLLPSKPVPVSAMPAPARMPTSVSSQKIQMHDMKAKPAALGPLDEIQYFSLIDLRRLSFQASEAVSRLKQKFVNLKEESFLLFIDSWSAWRNSGLYQSYMEAVDSALVQKRRLVSVVGEKEKISLAEIEAVIKMEKELEI